MKVLQKYKPCIVPSVFEGAPRRWIGSHHWQKIKKTMADYCVLCGDASLSQYDLHEHCEITGNVYKLTGLCKLCRGCHNLVHYFEANSVFIWRLSKCRGEIVMRLLKEVVRKRIWNHGLKQLQCDVYYGLTAAGMLPMYDNIIVDYSFLDRFGIDYKTAEDKYYAGSDISVCRSKFVDSIYRSLPLLENFGDEKTRKFYKEYLAVVHKSARFEQSYRLIKKLSEIDKHP